VVASVAEWKEQTIRRRDGSGEKELKGATAVILLRISSNEDGWKRMRLFRSVIRSVFVGGDGWESGMFLMSIDKAGRDDRDDLVVWGGEYGREIGGKDID